MKQSLSFALALIVIIGVSVALLGGDYMQLATHMLSSLARMGVGYALSIVVSGLFSILLGFSQTLRYAFRPLLGFLMAIPTITWVPLLLVLTGISETTMVLAIFLGSFFAMTFNTLEGFDSVPASLIRAGKIMGYGRAATVIKVIVPASFNTALVGLKMGIAYSWRALVGAEMLGATQQGLGYLVFASRMFYDIGLMLLALGLIGTLGFMFNRVLVSTIERNTIVKWGIQ